MNGCFRTLVTCCCRDLAGTSDGTERNGQFNFEGGAAQVYEVFREELDFLYTPEGKDIRNPRNTKNMKSMITWKI